ncbi:MAG: M1 family metallopeptidase [Gaiellales bacterium]
MGVISRTGIVAACAAAILAAVPAAASADPFFPHAGNHGYDVATYDLHLRYDPDTRELAGKATITATATKRLAVFDLDLRRLAVTRVKVAGATATFTRTGQELIITPRATVVSGSLFTTVVSYHGVPGPVIDPDGSREGWIPTDDGAFVAGEPQGAPTWFPANDTPADKATYTISMTVPKKLAAIGNGKLLSTTNAGGQRTFVWSEKRPMATYLATITLGRFDITKEAGIVPIYLAVDPREAAAAAPALAKLPKILAFEQKLIGPYPFENAGAIVDHNAGAGYALETQTKPVFDGAPDAETLAHELAHQWFGDSVTPRTWPDIWLNEGFATYMQWLWVDHSGGQDIADRFDDEFSVPATSRFWCTPPAALSGPSEMFSSPVYARGAMALYALRAEIGDALFLKVLHKWAAANRYGNVSTADFEALAERVTGYDLNSTFTTWLVTPRKPGSAVDPCS